MFLNILENYQFSIMNWIQFITLVYLVLVGMLVLNIYTKVSLELITDIDQYLFFELVSNHYSVANNPYIDNFNPHKPMKYLSRCKFVVWI